jgi:translation initiation factor RLI1
VATVWNVIDVVLLQVTNALVNSSQGECWFPLKHFQDVVVAPCKTERAQIYIFTDKQTILDVEEAWNITSLPTRLAAPGAHRVVMS